MTLLDFSQEQIVLREFRRGTDKIAHLLRNDESKVARSPDATPRESPLDFACNPP